MLVIRVTTILMLVTSGCAINNHRDITIGVLSQSYNNDLDILINEAIQQYNYGPEVTQFQTKVRSLVGYNSLEIKRQLCNLLRNNSVVSLIDIGLSRTPHLRQALCLNLKIPYIKIHWTESSTYPSDPAESETYLNFYPDADLLAQGLGAVVRSLRWENFIILYDDSFSLIKLKEILTDNVVVKKVDSAQYKSLLKEIKTWDIPNIVVACHGDKIPGLMYHAKELDMLESSYNYFLTSFDSHALQLKDLEAQANITTVTISDGSTSSFWTNNYNLNIVDASLKTEMALTYDAINLVMGAIIELANKNDPFSKAACHNNTTFIEGTQMVTLIKQRAPKHSLTHPMSFDALGRRTNFTLYVKEARTNNLIATWNPTNRRTVQLIERRSTTADAPNLKTLVVSSKLGMPYLMLVKSKNGTLSGNDQYEGYIMDLLNAIANHSQFNFTIQLSSHYGAYGHQTKTWDGMIGDVLYNRADLAAGDLTITTQRQEFVDFSMPFLRLGIGLLYKDVESNVSIFGFLNAFSVEVWLYIATLYLSVTIALYFIARMAPGDWENPHPCDQNPEEMENLWNIKNCLWITLGSIMNQGCDLLPKGISSRMASAMWFFFALIMTNSYTASLAAFLTTSKLFELKDIEDLAKQNRIKYGTVEGGATFHFFEQATYSPYKRIYANMILGQPSVLEHNNMDGVARVLSNKDGLYAFLMESTTIDYVVERYCQLKSVRKTISPRAFGIAMRRNFPFRERINNAILHLQEHNTLIDLKNKWWREIKDTQPCESKKTTSALTLDKVGGVFMVLGCGLVLGLILGLIEFFCNVWKLSIKDNDNYWTVFKKELYFALNVWVSKKRIRLYPPPLESSEPELNENVEL